MRFNHILSAALSLAAIVSSVVSAEVQEEISEPEIVVTAAFPESNVFNHVVNGQRNSLTLSIENKSDRNVTLLGVSGALYKPATNALIKNLTTVEYGFPLLESTSIDLPFTFYSEFKSGDVRLELWLEHADGDKKYRVAAYQNIVTIVEPPISWLDWQMWSTYIVVTGILGGLSYFAYLSFAPQPKRRTKKAPVVSAPVAVTATGSGGYEEEWIPEHHLRKNKKSQKQGGVVSGTSGDEVSAAEVSGTEGKKRKGRK